MKYKTHFLTTAILITGFGDVTLAADDQAHHLPHNHIAILAGYAQEETPDGHFEDGNLWGFDYLRQFHEHWGWGVTFEQEGFGGNDQKRHGILAIPVSYFINSRWRVFAAPAIEFREPGEPDKPAFRIGTGYGFHLSERFSLWPEVQVDFIAGGTNVYVFALALGYGF